MLLSEFQKIRIRAGVNFFLGFYVVNLRYAYKRRDVIC